VSGQVIVEALVLPDGTVGETWIIKSIPELDEAAARAVQHWRFTPALDGDKTTAVWIALPVDFTLP
jgi:TonB family protein